MKTEAWIFGICTIVFLLITPSYWFMSQDWTGTWALAMATLLVMMIALYLGAHAVRMDERPEDRIDGEIADGAGELGFFPPYSWWPLWVGATFAVSTYAVALAAWWMLLISGILLMMAIIGWLFEYYRGEHAH